MSVAGSGPVDNTLSQKSGMSMIMAAHTQHSTAMPIAACIPGSACSATNQTGGAREAALLPPAGRHDPAVAGMTRQQQA